MRLVVLTGLLCACTFAIACGGPAPTPAPGASNATPASAPAVPEEFAAVARGAFGSEGEALAWGDLSLSGSQQVLVVSRLHGAPGAQSDELFFTRLAIGENDGGHWTQVLLCDEHLKNEKGYLGGAPGDIVSRWKLSYVKDPVKGLVLSITPMGLGSDALGKTIRVRWNPKVKRYQSLDGSSEHFMNETSSLDIVQRSLAR
ncbi:MAG: hypothetical protein WAM91_15815 [Candidatus Acidiferrales bacterium]